MKEIDAVPVHIHIGNVDGHHTVTPETLFALIEAYDELFHLLNVKADIQIGVPRKGSWEATFEVLIKYVGISVVVAFVTGLSPEDWAKAGHKTIVGWINRLLTTTVVELPEETPSDFFRKRNKLYERLKADETVASVKLGEASTIPRQDFPLYINELSDEEPVYLGEVELMVSSPDWKGKRSWRGRIVGTGEKMQSFTFDKILTKKFWQRVHQNDLIIRTTEDTLRVQLALHPTEKTKHCIIRVLEYNGEIIDRPLSDAYIAEMYSVRSDNDTTPRLQLKLF